MNYLYIQNKQNITALHNLLNYFCNLNFKIIMKVMLIAEWEIQAKNGYQWLNYLIYAMLIDYLLYLLL